MAQAFAMKFFLDNEYRLMFLFKEGKKTNQNLILMKGQKISNLIDRKKNLIGFCIMVK